MAKVGIRKRNISGKHWGSRTVPKSVACTVHVAIHCALIRKGESFGFVGEVEGTKESNRDDPWASEG